MRRYTRWVLIVFFAPSLLASCAGMSLTLNTEKAFRSKNYQTAASGYEELIQHHEPNWKTRIKLGYCYLKMGLHSKAVLQFQEAISNKYAEPWAKFYMGLAYLYQGMRAEAIDSWEDFKDQNRPKLEEAVAKELMRQKTLVTIQESERLVQQALS